MINIKIKITSTNNIKWDYNKELDGVGRIMTM